MPFKVAVIGAGPAGAHLSSLLSQQGRRVTLYEFRAQNREKPCAGGLTHKLFADTQIQETLPIRSRSVAVSRIMSWNDRHVDVRLEEPVRVVSRKDFDGYLLETALKAGVKLVKKRANFVEQHRNRWRVSAGGTSEEYDYVVGADGINSVVRKRLSTKFRAHELYRSCGYFVKGLAEDKMVIKFFRGLEGYVWIFPGPDCSSVGICGTAHKHHMLHLHQNLATFMARHYPDEQLKKKKPFAWLIPSLPQAQYSCLRISGPGWALVGDAAGLADPVTGEGIYYAIRSAEILARCLLSNAADDYAHRVCQELGGNLIRAASLKKIFFTPGFIENTVLLAKANRDIQSLLSDLYSGAQDYLSLKRRLTRCLFPCVKDLFFQEGMGGLARALLNVGHMVYEKGS